MLLLLGFVVVVGGEVEAAGFVAVVLTVALAVVLALLFALAVALGVVLALLFVSAFALAVAWGLLAAFPSPALLDFALLLASGVQVAGVASLALALALPLPLAAGTHVGKV